MSKAPHRCRLQTTVRHRSSLVVIGLTENVKQPTIDSLILVHKSDGDDRNNHKQRQRNKNPDRHLSDPRISNPHCPPYSRHSYHKSLPDNGQINPSPLQVAFR